MTTDDRLAALVDETDQVRRWKRLRAFVTSEPSAARAIGEHGLTSDDPRTREVAADVLGSVASVDRTSAAAIADVLISRLEVEQDAGVLDSVITALGHARDSRARAGVLKYAEHPDENVRFAVAWSLPALDLDDDTLAVLRRLSADPDEEVRDWATFGLAESEARDPTTTEATGRPNRRSARRHESRGHLRSRTTARPEGRTADRARTVPARPWCADRPRPRRTRGLIQGRRSGCSARRRRCRPPLRRS